MWLHCSQINMYLSILNTYILHTYTDLHKLFMRNAGLDEAQAGIKVAGRNTNNLRYADDTTLMA